MELSERKDRVLYTVVRDYIRSGEPVGSKAIAEEIGVSSATVRNEMADLIELGLLEQPHTSAGRVPTYRGYREFVDRLMKVPALREEERRGFHAELLSGGYEAERLLYSANRILSGVSRYAAAATTPSGETARVKAVQFVQTGRRTAMLLLMSSAGTLKTRVFHCEYDITHEMMRIYFRMFNERLAGREVSDITPAFLQTMAASLGEMYALVSPALQALHEAARDTMETELLLSGQMNLLFCGELEARDVMALLERRTQMSALLRQKPGRPTVLIGAESGVPELRDASLLVSRYEVGDQDAGALAVLGPMRMDYGRLIAVLQYLSGEVSRLLTVLMQEE